MGDQAERTRVLGGCLVRSAVLGLFLILLAFDAFAVTGGTRLVTSGGGLLIVASGAFAVICLVFLEPLRRWAAIAGLISIGVTVLLAVLRAPMDLPVGLWGTAETGALLLMIIRVIIEVPSRRTIGGLALVLSLAVLIAPMRTYGVSLGAAWIPVIIVALATAIGIGAYLRSLGNQRVRAMSEIRQAERMEIARDLHDFVAHHVTGIIVQTQAARHVGGTVPPAQLDEMLGRIEKSATEAMASMRRLVHVIRSTGEEEATRLPATDLARTAELVHAFSEGGPRATFTSTLSGEPPPEIGTTMYRIVQEALTNVRRHAIGATEVDVVVGPGEGGAVLSIRDNGRGAHPPRGGGFGLAGLAERAEALDGTLIAGPRPEGGFEVVARLPYSA